MRHPSLIVYLAALLLLLPGCAPKTDDAAKNEAPSAETQAPIYSSNVPLEYLVMANQSRTLAMQHEGILLSVDHILYGKTETYIGKDLYYRKDGSSHLLSMLEEAGFAAVLTEETEKPVLQYRSETPEEQLFLQDDFQLLAPSEGEEILEEAEYDGAFHVITERPIGSDAEFYSMLKTDASDRIREEYVLDAGSLALLSDTTTLLKQDGSEEEIGTLTVSYDGELPDTAARLRDYLKDALESSKNVTVTLHEEGQADRVFEIKKDTLFRVDAGGRAVTKDGSKAGSASPLAKDAEFTISE